MFVKTSMYKFCVHQSSSIISRTDGRAVKALASGASREICVGVSCASRRLVGSQLLTGHQSNPTLFNILFAHVIQSNPTPLNTFFAHVIVAGRCGIFLLLWWARCGPCAQTTRERERGRHAISRSQGSALASSRLPITRCAWGSTNIIVFSSFLPIAFLSQPHLVPLHSPFAATGCGTKLSGKSSCPSRHGKVDLARIVCASCTCGTCLL